MNSFADIIAAVSTPPGKGGVAIIRISGEGALSLAERFFFPASGKTLGSYHSRTQVYGFVTSKDGKRIDDGLATCFEAGRSFTGEETVEITSHGGVLVTSMVLEEAFLAGARAAEPGEFTRRAFVNGKLTLSDAEAIGMLLDAESREQVALFSEEARKKLNESFSDISTTLTELLGSAYARIDYPDEDLGDFSDGEMRDMLLLVKEKITALLATYKTGRAIKDGIKTVIAGKPNAGKSSIYNAILGEDAAIVTDIKGTTTDVLERTAVMDRVTLRLFDTAGLREDADAGVIERIGIERTRKSLADAELVLAVFDLSEELDESDLDLIKTLGKLDCEVIAILNKTDARCAAFDEEKIRKKFDTVVPFSAIEAKNGLTELSKTVCELFTDERIRCGDTPIISTARQHSALSGALQLVDTAIAAIDAGLPSDLVSSDIERALRAIAEEDGKEVSEAVTNDIFSRFCVGK